MRTQAIAAVAADGSATLSQFGIGQRNDLSIGADQAILGQPAAYGCQETYSPGFLWMPVELKPGQRYTLPRTTLTSSCDRDWYITDNTSGTVSGPEMVTVKAGTFYALRIDTVTEGFSSYYKQTTIVKRSFWRDTVTGLVVKRSSDAGGYDELLSYAQGSTGRQFLGPERLQGKYQAQANYYGKCTLTFYADLSVIGSCYNNGSKSSFDVKGTFNVAGDFTATVRGASEVTTMTGRTISPFLVLVAVNNSHAKGNFNRTRM